MDAPTIVTLLIGGIDLIALVVGAVWAVGTVRTAAESTAATLKVSIDDLSASVNSLERGLEKFEATQTRHEVRITVLETLTRMTQPVDVNRKEQ